MPILRNLKREMGRSPAAKFGTRISAKQFSVICEQRIALFCLMILPLQILTETLYTVITHLLSHLAIWTRSMLSPRLPVSLILFAPLCRSLLIQTLW